MAPSFVYFMRPVGMTGPTKIGFSISPAQRLLALAQWSPFPLEIVATVDGPRSLERKFHDLLAAHWSHHEWFHDHEDVASVVQAVIDGTFDFSRLDQTETSVAKIKPVSVRERTRKLRSAKIRFYWASYGIGLEPPKHLEKLASRLRWISDCDLGEAIAELEVYIRDPFANGAVEATHPRGRELFARYVARHGDPRWQRAA